MCLYYKAAQLFRVWMRKIFEVMFLLSLSTVELIKTAVSDFRCFTNFSQTWLLTGTRLDGRYIFSHTPSLQNIPIQKHVSKAKYYFFSFILYFYFFIIIIIIILYLATFMISQNIQYFSHICQVVEHKQRAF